MIHKTKEGGFVISAYRVWRPGYYETEKAARMAQRRTDEQLQQLQVVANERAGGSGGTITEADLKDAK